MLTEEFVSATRGPPLTTNTAFVKEAGIFTHTLNPNVNLKSTFKKSSAPPNCIAVSDTHVFSAQHEKAYVHVYSRIKGNQEAFIPFPERIHCVTLVGDVLLLGTAEGRLFLWETCTGRLVTTPARHIQAVSAIAGTSRFVLTGSEDSSVYAWSLLSLLELNTQAEHEPEQTLSSHRAGITALAVTGSSNPATSYCVSSSKDKTCIIWNYRSGESLRTILLPSSPTYLALDSAGRAVHVSTDDGAIHKIDFFGQKAIIGPHSAEDAATAMQVGDPWAIVPSEAGPPLCMALSYDGTTLLTGHGNGHILRWNTTTEIAQPIEIASLNAAVTNIVPLSPLPKEKYTKAVTVVRPSQNDRRYTFQSQFTTDLYSGETPSRFDRLLNGTGFPQDVVAEAISALAAPGVTSEVDADLQQQNEELWQVIDEQRALQSDLMERYIALRNAQATDPAVSGGGR